MEIKFNKRDLDQAEFMLRHLENGFSKAIYRALNLTAQNAGTEMVALSRAAYTYKAGHLRERITVYKCPSYQFLKASIRSVGPGVHLTDLPGTNQTAKGVMVNVKKATGRKLIRHAFIAPGRKSGKEIVFMRETEGGKMVGRTPISALYASEPEIIYNTKENWPKLEKAIGGRLDKNFKHEVEVVLKGIA